MTKTVPPADYQQMLVRLQESAPLLSHLHLNADVPPYDPTIISAMSNAICTFKHLVSVRTGPLPITEQAFRYLAELPHLEVINVRLPDTITEASFRRAPFDEIFPSLRELRLAHLFNLNLISLIVQHTRSPRLEIISAESVDEDRPVPLEDVMSFFSAILSRNNAEHIKELTIEALPIEWTPQNTFTNQHLEPLFALKSLTTLKLHLRCTFDLDDVILERTARAWPNIRTLDLGPGSTGVRVPSLAALIPFAQHCPELQVLGFTLDADLCRVPPDIRDSARDYAQRELRVLKVGCAEVADPRCVAAFLADLFPHLRDIECGSIDANGMEIGAAAEWDWEEVCEEHLPAAARERGIVFEPTLDEIDARVMKAWYIGRRTSEQ
ncbi:hypothetical protein GSI_06878 [Ganoderma sinense ZZ0214-1]|uniref:Uncharacterized protein n=1 Tax=Ganoderma sinense ZZ0214-1 TaxID=1077348 RepID=A0A2G8SAC4_9APHY|nr:hypothetical protein GSI_06878 [Ganoderma sinense ZZ0214-1]